MSIDYLVDDEHEIDMNITKEAIELSDKKGSKKHRKELLVREKFPENTIYALQPYKITSKQENVLDWGVAILTDVPFGLPQVINQFKLMNDAYFLVDTGESQYLVDKTDDFMETRRTISKVSVERGYSFVSGELKFVNAGEIK